MTPDKYIVIFGGISLIALIWWFFFGNKNESELVRGNIKIVVSGGYKPSTIKIHRGDRVTLSIVRTEKNSCLEEIVIPEFKINEYLPLNEVVNIEINAEKKGEFEFHCGMNMYHGKVVVI